MIGLLQLVLSLLYAARMGRFHCGRSHIDQGQIQLLLWMAICAGSYAHTELFATHWANDTRSRLPTDIQFQQSISIHDIDCMVHGTGKRICIIPLRLNYGAQIIPHIVLVTFLFFFLRNFQAKKDTCTREVKNVGRRINKLTYVFPCNMASADDPDGVKLFGTGGMYEHADTMHAN